MAKSVKIGITGLPGSGKTEALEKVIGMLEGDQKTVGGMVTKPMTDQHRLVGIYVIDWMTKQTDVLAHIDYESNVSVGRFGVDMKKLETTLMDEGLKKFADPQKALLALIAKKRQELQAAAR